ncbi:hypothetical protein ILUMI_26445 [Ignelater luminosus]|uniref:SIAH-type domain-containing protein n=1 Tax=Ignelater luminosus TaxID=2038154 RepID=A0A8K0C8G3_IGNLU|nr:hypothetical protein ILUMI_26445 [Ignelater luminosus]
MSEKHIINISESTLEQLHCYLCNGYLSCGPVRVLSDGSCVCGRCSPLNSDAPIYRVLSFEAVLSKMLFPCRFNQRGCAESLLYGKTIVDHELKCLFRSFVCPLISNVGCTWEGSALEMFAHFNKNHCNFIINDGKFKISLQENSQGIFMIIKDCVGFIFKYQYDSSKTSLNYDIRYCRNEILHDATYKINLFNSSDLDCMIGLKARNCSSYSESFQDFQNPLQLNLNNYLQNLDNPNDITIQFSIVHVGANSASGEKLNHKLLSTLRCEVCRNYLLPPLYDLENQIICCDCAKGKPESIPSSNLKVQKLATETKFPCRWRECKFIGKSENFKVHELNCKFRYYDCFFPSCQVTFKLASAIEHLQIHRAQYMTNKLNYKTSFSQSYNFKHLFIIRNNLIIILQHSLIESDENKDLIHRVALFSSDPDEIIGNIEFEHQHCKLKSKRFIIASKHKTDITLTELPSCFKTSDELLVAVNI